GTSPDVYEGDRRDAALAENWGGALMRPDRAFRFAGGRLVVEFDAAAGMAAYHDGWPELVVTTAAAPTGTEVDPTHAIGLFGGAASAGCRLYTDRTSLCSSYDGSGVRRFELSAARAEGAASSRGGDPGSAPAPAAWRVCAP